MFFWAIRINMEDIDFKQYYLNRCIYWWFAISALVWYLVFLTLNIPREDRWALSSFIMGTGLYFVLYLNRLEPKHIALNEHDFEITYYNLQFFKRQDGTHLKREIRCSRESGSLILSNDTGIVAKIRKKSLSVEDWGILEKYFN